MPIAANNGPGAIVAKGALARAGVNRLVPYLQRDGAGRDARLRIEAGTALSVLGDLPHAAQIAADPEPRVRTAVACAILRAWAAW